MTHALPNKRKTTYTSQLLDPLQSERGVRYWEVIYKRLSNLGLKILSAIQGMSAIWDFRY